MEHISKSNNGNCYSPSTPSHHRSPHLSRVSRCCSNRPRFFRSQSGFLFCVEPVPVVSAMIRGELLYPHMRSCRPPNSDSENVLAHREPPACFVTGPTSTTAQRIPQRLHVLRSAWYMETLPHT